MLRERLAGASVLDLCTGSGMLAVSAALHGAQRVVAVDVSHRAVLSVRLNARLNGVRIRAERGDLFEPVRGERFDLIVSNPPYVPSASSRIPRWGLSRAWAAGPDGRMFLDRICAQVAGHLNPGGVALIVQNALVGQHQTLEALSRHGLEPTVALRREGPLGPRLRREAAWLRARGLLEGDQDEVLVIRGEAPRHSSPVDPTHQVREGHLLG